MMLMKKWMNTLFFGSLFIVAIILETYGMVVWDGNLFSVVALGVVVLITGYLFMDSIRSKLKQGSEDAKFYFDRVLNEESEQRSERHTEIINLQKASYTATKKNAVLLTEQFTEVLSRLEVLEENNSRTLQKIIELQRTSLEGQKNALNLEISYSKDNTRRIIEAMMKEEPQENQLNEQLSMILRAMEENNRLIKEQMQQSAKVEHRNDFFEDSYVEDDTPPFEVNSEFLEDNTHPLTVDMKSYEDESVTSWQPTTNGFMEDLGFEEVASATEASDIEESLKEASDDEEEASSAEALDFEEAASFAEASEFDEAASFIKTTGFTKDTDFTEAAGFIEDMSFSEEEQEDEGFSNQFQEEDTDTLLKEAADTKEASFYEEEDSLTGNAVPEQEAYSEDFYSELNITDHINDFLSEESGEEIEENAPESDWSIQDDLEPEADILTDNVEASDKKVIPLYDDPNKALTADEIAALFASFGS